MLRYHVTRSIVCESRNINNDIAYGGWGRSELMGASTLRVAIDFLLLPLRLFFVLFSGRLTPN